MDEPADDDPLLGAVVGGRYRIEAELGRGGMGVVYRGEHLELGQKVAVKVLTSDVLGTKSAVDRFLREARTTASLGHPNIVRVQDLGKLDDGRPYLVMELLEGEGVDELLGREGTLSPARVAALLSPAAAALDAIHGLGLVHRDVKPENLFVARVVDGSETVKLVDFGLVGMSRPDFDEKRLTQTGLIYGTPPYMAPETMAERTPSPSWDVYALAVVAFELLTGRVPFVGDNPLETLTRRTLEDPPSLSEVSGRRHPEAVEKVIRRGLSRFADARYESAGALAEAFAEAASASVADETGDVSVPVPLTVERSPAAPPRSESETSVVSGRTSVGTPMQPDAAQDLEERVILPTTRLRPVVLVVASVLAIGAAVAALMLAGDDEPATIALTGPADAEAERDSGPGAQDAEIVDAGTALSPRRDARPGDAASDSPAPDPTTTSMRRRTSSMSPDVDEQESVDLAGLEREAQVALARGNVGAAQNAYRRITRAEPSRASAWRGLGVAAERLGRTDEAIRAYRRYLSLAPGAPEAPSIRDRLARLASDD